MMKPIIGAAAIAFLILFGKTIMDGQAMDWNAFLADPWVSLGMADLVLGFVLTSCIIAAVEGSLLRAIPWIVGVFIAGNVVTAVFLIIRFEKIFPRLAPVPAVSAPSPSD